MFLTEAELREMWRDGRGALPAFPPGTRFSPSAADFLKAHGLRVEFTTAPAAQPLTPDPLTPDPLRARLATLHAALLLAGAHARRFRLPELAARLAALADAIAQGQSVPLAGAGDHTAHAEPAAPAPGDHEMLLWLNFARALARETELEARAASPPAAQALADLAQAVAALERDFRSGQLSWKMPGNL